MVNRLEPLDITSYVGGLNLRASSFQLAEDESPDLLNVDVDPRGGFYTRRGWQRWNDDDIVDTDVVDWKPRSAFVHNWANGDQRIYVVNDGMIYSAGSDSVFTELAIPDALAEPHGADMAAWGDTVYFACGRTEPSYRKVGAAAPVALGVTFSEVDSPTVGMMPQADFVETHAGYLFVASTEESSIAYPARIRWSHPNRPDAWRDDDYIDIDAGGGEITSIVSFSDHLLIFKTHSTWALYGYDSDSWQLIRVSATVGATGLGAIARSEVAVYFFSRSDRGGIYAYTGEGAVHISEKVKPALEGVFNYDNVFVSWAGQRLWVAIPWVKGAGSTADVSTCLVFDPGVGSGAWVMYNSPHGAIATVLDGSDGNAKYPLAAFWSEETAAMMTLDFIDDGYDEILMPPVLGTGAGEIIETGLGEDIGIGGWPAQTFEAHYRTRWLHANWPDRKKSWRRPTFVCKQVLQDTDLIVESFRDYDETTVHRSRTLTVRATGAAFWREDGYTDGDDGGFDWKESGAADPSGRGADWGSARAGASLVRGGSMGLARAVQLRVRVSPTTSRRKWGIDAIIAKYVMRRYR